MSLFQSPLTCWSGCTVLLNMCATWSLPLPRSPRGLGSLAPQNSQSQQTPAHWPDSQVPTVSISLTAWEGHSADLLAVIFITVTRQSSGGGWGEGLTRAVLLASLSLACGPKPWLKRIGEPCCMVWGAPKSVSKHLNKDSPSRSPASIE